MTTTTTHPAQRGKSRPARLLRDCYFRAESLLARPRLGRAARLFPDSPKSLRPLADELRPDYDDYVANVSTPDYALSLELAALLLHLVRAQRPRTIIDMGSGFSTFVFCKARRDLSLDATIISVDTDPRWAEKSLAFLGDRGLEVDQLLDADQARDALPTHADLVFHDLNGLPARPPWIPILSQMIGDGGILIIDDCHKPIYWRQCRRMTKRSGRQFASLRGWTLDHYGRFAGAAL